MRALAAALLLFALSAGCLSPQDATLHLANDRREPVTIHVAQGGATLANETLAPGGGAVPTVLIVEATISRWRPLGVEVHPSGERATELLLRSRGDHVVVIVHAEGVSIEAHRSAPGWM